MSSEKAVKEQQDTVFYLIITVIIVIISSISMYRVFTSYQNLCWVLYIIYISFSNDPGERYYYDPHFIGGKTRGTERLS